MEEEFVGTSDTSIIGNLVWTGLQATRVLRTLSRHADADAVTDSLVKRFDHLSARVIKQGLGWSLAEQSETHESVDDFERATNHCAQFIEQWGNSDRQPDVFEDLIAWVYAQRAYYFRGAKRYDEAIAVCNDVDERFGSSTNIEVQVEVARALLQKVVALRHSKRLSACSTAAKALLRRFADATDKRIIAQRRWAIYAQGFALAHEAKLFRQNGLHEDSVLKLELASSPMFQ